jgi:hypothetical protein
MDPHNFQRVSCAICRQNHSLKNISVVQSDQIDFTLLTNPCLPDNLQPSAYNFKAYDRAILYYKGLHDKNEKGDIDICKSCRHELIDQRRQPLDSLANFQWSAQELLPESVRTAIESATMFDMMMVARLRATRLTHLYSSKKDSPLFGSNPDLSQKYSCGNVAILPQDSVSLRTVVPPNLGEIQQAMAALFVGGRERPTLANIKRLSPVLVSKQCIRTIIQFLLTENSWYRMSGLTYSKQNMDDLFAHEEGDVDESVPRGVDLCYLPPEHGDMVENGTAGYTDRYKYTEEQNSDTDQIVMEAVGYVAGDDFTESYHHMKATALAWCLDHKKSISNMRA